MRALLTLAVAIVVSWVVSYFAQLMLGIALNAGEELIVAMVLQVVFVIGVGIVFGLVLAASGGARALGIAATTIVVVGFLGLAGLEAFTLIDESMTLAPNALPLLAEIGIPALLAVIVQWWLVRRHLRRSAPPALLAAAPN